MSCEDCGKGPRQSYEPRAHYPVVDDGPWPWGLHCDGCKRLLRPGQPFTTGLSGMADDGLPVYKPICVYCETPAATERKT